jgi:hypothetical protein
MPSLLKLKEKNVTSLAGVPSWMLLLNKMLVESGKESLLKFGLI